MIRLLRTLLIGLLKLVLQLIILVVTGKWVRIGPGERQPHGTGKGARKRRERARPAGPAQAGSQRPLFDRRGSPSRARDLSGGTETLAQRGALWGAELLSSEAAFEEGGSRSERGRQRAPKRRGREQPQTPPAPRRTSLARALRDPRAIRQAILVGSAVAPRRR